MNEFLTQSQLAEKLVQRTGIKFETAKQFSSVFFTIVKKGLKNSESFSVYNFGTFKKTWIEATTGINPGNGEKINISAHWRIKFVPCAAVARRLNKPYENLKAKEIPEDSIIPETADEPDDDFYNDELGIDENDFEDEPENTAEKESSRKNLKILALAGIFLLIFILIISILIKSCSYSTKKIQKTKEESQPAQKETEIISAAPEETESYEEKINFETFAVPSGSNYHIIAEQKYKNRHLWPVLFSANKTLSADPDFVAKYKDIKIPELPANETQKKNLIENSVLDAYNAYLLMCEKEPESNKNAERKLRATRVLVSGELLSPGFLTEHKTRILPEYLEMAENIVLHQYR
jgi:nucleoid DNA-binding protein